MTISTVHLRPKNNNEEPFWHYEAIQLLQELQTSLDLEQIVIIFYKVIKNKLPVVGCEYKNIAVQQVHKLGQVTRFKLHYHLQLEHTELGDITFYQTQPATSEEALVLENLLATLLYPLLNCITHWQALQNAYLDTLVPMGNRRAMFMALHTEIESAKRHHQGLCLMMIDIDNFKHINDHHGHLVGDKLLQQYGTWLIKCLRECDMIYRYGGDEFVVILKNTLGSGAIKLAERFMVHLHVEAHKNTEILDNTTVSIGLTELQHDDSLEAIFKRADSALYAAKQNGKDQIAYL